jgi:hypothetical protein
MNTVFPLLQSCFVLYPFYYPLTPPFPFSLEKAPASQVFICYYFIIIIAIATWRPHLHSHQSDAPQYTKTLESTALQCFISQTNTENTEQHGSHHVFQYNEWHTTVLPLDCLPSCLEHPQFVLCWEFIIHLPVIILRRWVPSSGFSFSDSSPKKSGARGSVVGWGTTLQAGRSWVRIPMRSLDFFNWPNPSSRTMALGSTQPLTEMSTRNLPGGKRVAGTCGWHPQDHLWAVWLENVGASTSHNPMDLHGLLQR